MNRIRKLPSSFVFTIFFSDPTTPSTGNATRLCDANGRWTGSEPKCQPIACGDPVTFPHTTVALINGSTSWKAVAQFSCIFGYQPFNGKFNFDEKTRLKSLSVSLGCTMNSKIYNYNTKLPSKVQTVCVFSINEIQKAYDFDKTAFIEDFTPFYISKYKSNCIVICRVWNPWRTLKN